MLHKACVIDSRDRRVENIITIQYVQVASKNQAVHFPVAGEYSNMLTVL